MELQLLELLPTYARMGLVTLTVPWDLLTSDDAELVVLGPCLQGLYHNRR